MTMENERKMALLVGDVEAAASKLQLLDAMRWQGHPRLPDLLLQNNLEIKNILKLTKSLHVNTVWLKEIPAGRT